MTYDFHRWAWSLSVSDAFPGVTVKKNCWGDLEKIKTDQEKSAMHLRKWGFKTISIGKWLKKPCNPSGLFGTAPHLKTARRGSRKTHRSAVPAT